MMRAQARSFAVHVPAEIVNKIYIVLNGKDIGAAFTYRTHGTVMARTGKKSK